MAQNQAPDVDAFCVDTQIPEASPVIRFPGGAVIEPQVDPQSVPTNCTLTLDMVGQLQTALAPFQPVLTILDTVATIGQCFILMTEALTNPFKIPDLLACIPGLVGKINRLLQLVPIFPQGIQSFITFIVDVMRFTAAQIDCVVSILEGLRVQFAELARISDRINTVDDVEIVENLQTLFDCGTQEAEQQLGIALGALGPIARILCTVRGILAIIPGGNEVQKQLAFPDPTNVSGLDAAIATLSGIRDALLLTEDVLEALTLGLGFLPPPEVGFRCPLDDVDTSSEDRDPDPATPQIFNVLEPTGLPLIPPTAGTPEKTVVIVGSNLTDPLADPSKADKVYFGASPLPESAVVLVSVSSLTITIPGDLLTSAGSYPITVINKRRDGDGTGPFQGLDGSSVGGEDNSGQGVFASNTFTFTVDA